MAMNNLFLMHDELQSWQQETWFPYASQSVQNMHGRMRIRLDANTFGTFRVSKQMQGQSHFVVEYEGKDRQVAVDTFNDVSGF